MYINPMRDVFFDDEATLAMGTAFDQSCKSLRHFGRAVTVHEIIAKRIVAAAKNGMRDPIQLHEQALKAFDIEGMSTPSVSVDRDVPVPVYASIACVA
jgi:hypothetical protein